MTDTLTLPSKPYPGMRPFFENETSLLLGRDTQVNEIIDRLRDTKFVAVVGGSGSGKSSIIRAGVVPKLRGYGIADAGSYWIPIVWTPGTVETQEDHLREQTPVTRLAWKVSRVLLRVTDSMEMQRRAEIATVFRQGGFSQLVDVYHKELPERGPDRSDARFLFVIDQFEELFHPCNRTNEDARRVVEAVIDQFSAPHERTFVVMTMRSEHLSDCAAYLELPDAINRSMYLVRRLDEDELRRAIVDPAQNYLRLVFRGSGRLSSSLPSTVAFEERVIDRLLADTASITDDPDHLPLLQHVLARLWHAACAREAVGEGVPARVCWADLERAVLPGLASPRPSLEERDDLNVLRDSLENWADYTYGQRPTAEQAQIDAVLQKLGFKNPTNGLYFQRRVDVDSPTLLPGLSHPRERLKQILGAGFISVKYLFLDEEDPDHPTLKVSHEAFIRGWKHFRNLVDYEAERFDGFVDVLRKCARWRQNSNALLEEGDLARLDELDLNQVFEISDRRHSWFDILLQYRRGEGLSETEAEVGRFIAASRASVARQHALAKEHREAVAWRRRLWWLIPLATMTVVFTASVVIVLSKTMGSLHKFNVARSIADRVEKSSIEDLNAMLRSASELAKAKHGETFVGLPVNKLWDGGTVRRFVSASAETAVNGRLRNMLAATVWRTSHSSDRGPLWHDSYRMPCELPLETQVASPTNNRPPQAVTVWGIGLFGTGIDPDGRERPGNRSLFVPDLFVRDRELRLYDFEDYDGVCKATRLSWSIPRYLEPALLFDSTMSRLLVAVKDPRAHVLVHRVNWRQDEDPRQSGAYVTFLSDLSDNKAAELVRQHVTSSELLEQLHSLTFQAAWSPPLTTVAPTRRGRAWLDLSIAGSSWRVISETSSPRSAEGWEELRPAIAGSRCHALGETLARHRAKRSAADTEAPVDERLVVLDHRSFCFEVFRTRKEQSNDGGAHQRLVGVVYDTALLDAHQTQAELLTPIAALDFGWVAGIKQTWLVGVSPETYGWIGFRRPDSTMVVAVPWATSALVELGRNVEGVTQQ